MKKIFFFFLFSLLFIPNVYAEENLLQGAKSGILIENSTGEILYEKNKNEKVSIASLTKMMVQIIVLENIEAGNIKWNDVVTASSNASGMGGTQIWLSTGEKMSVEDLFKGMSIASANDATVALAEYISGTEDNFVKLMNKKVNELGLKNTVFKNCTGLDQNGHFSTAEDLAVIARELLKHEEIYRFSSVYEDYIRVNTPNKYWLVNTNKLVRFYEGADGLKTGFTDDAGYTMAVTAKRNNMRLIAIVLGEKESKVRNNETIDLLNFGFDNFKVELLKNKGEVIETVEIERGTKDKIELVTKDELSILTKKSNPNVNYTYNVVIDNFKLPVKKGDVIGKIELIDKNKIVKNIDLISNDTVNKIGIFKFLFSYFTSVF